MTQKNKMNWTLTYWRQSNGNEGPLPTTTAYLVCNDCFEEIVKTVTGHLTAGQLIKLFDCKYYAGD